MPQFKYVGEKFFAEKVSIEKITSKNKTPFYLYSENQIKENFLNFKRSFKQVNPIICFAAKANSNLSILRLLGKLGAGADVVSGGELLKAIKAGINPNKIVFSGVGKTEEEILIAIKHKILLINIESESEAKLIDKIALKQKKIINVGFRLNPNIDAKTHKKISTGKAENKFGISIKEFHQIFKNKERFNNLKIQALSVHIGSQILSDIPYKKTLGVLLKIIKELNIKLKFIDLGGGFGINYSHNEQLINFNNYAKLVLDFKKKTKCNIIFEPGRFLVGNSGILVSKVQYIKNGTNKNFIILDAGMNDFMRPALYDAQHSIIPVNRSKNKNKGTIEFVGPICETTCKFGKFKNYQKLNEGDFVAIANAGAYGSSLSSNYNTKPLISELIVNNKKIKIIRKKQDLFKLINS